MSKTVDDGGAAMSEDIVQVLEAARTVLLRADGDRDPECQSNITTDTSMALADAVKTAADTIEALRGEVEALKQAVEAERDEQARVEFRLREREAEAARLKGALEWARLFIADQYSLESDDGEWLAPEARKIYATLCKALAGETT